MALWQSKSVRKKTGGRYRAHRKKRKFEMGREHTEVAVGKRSAVQIRVRGGDYKTRLLIAESANVVNPKTKETKTAKILGVIENSANPHFVRRNIITKGAIINTEIGKARVTSRPGQDGSVSAVLVE
ncbi:MAG: 30S ribosomal protein S8e [Euryarchaeota archaeon]|nr:30S ribosomal protein S8e [Euryarchaeota archaeon]